MSITIEESWKDLLFQEFQKEYFGSLISFVKEEYRKSKVYPSGKQIFRAFDHTSVDKTKVIILGQDPYHTPGVANGLAFSVNPEAKLPPSLRNIYKELKDDLSIDRGVVGDLSDWAEQGVLLLNSTLTVNEGKPGSHQDKGWELFTDAAIQAIEEIKDNLVFILWGSYARKKGEFIDRNRHLVLESPHPSPFSADRGFFGSKPFSQTNAYLKKNGLEGIKW